MRPAACELYRHLSEWHGSAAGAKGAAASEAT